MNIDATAKQFFPAIVCALVAVSAYFQAQGVNGVVAGELPPPPAAKAPATRHLTPTVPPKTASALPILSRNAFDSVTGPLNGVKPLPPPSEEPVAHDSGEDPPCSSGSVVLIADSEDPAWSFAVIKGSGSQTKMRRIGDDIDGQTVKAITWDHVTLTSGSSRCQLAMLTGKKTPDAPETSKKISSDDKDSRPKKSSDSTDLSGDVTKISDTEFVVAKSAQDRIASLQKEMTKNARIVPGKGIRVSRAQNTSALGQLGLSTGDIIHSINGFDMTDPDKAIEAYSRLKTSSDVTLDIERNGKPTTIHISVK